MQCNAYIIEVLVFWRYNPISVLHQVLQGSFKPQAMDPESLNPI